MNLIKLFFFLFLLSSCNKYLGKIEPDYSPSKEVTQIFSSDTKVVNFEKDIIFGSTKYPSSKSFSKNLNFSNMQKIATSNEDTKIYSNSNNIFFSKKKFINKNK